MKQKEGIYTNKKHCKSGKLVHIFTSYAAFNRFNISQLAIIVLSILIFPSFYEDSEKTCYLTGKVVNRDSKTLILLKQTEDFRYNGIEIPIDSLGRFNYKMNFQFIEAYELIFKEEFIHGGWNSNLFFPDNDTIEFTLYPMEEADSNKIVGSELSLKEKTTYQKLKDRYYDRYIFWEQKMDSLISINETNSNFYSTISDSLYAIGQEIALYELQCGVKEQVNIYGFSKLLKIFKIENSRERRLIPIDSLKKYCDLFQKEFPNHPYNEVAQFRLNGLTNIKVGGDYVNFTAQDSNANYVTLSEVISKNKFTLLDLWSPWCGPCIRNSQKNISLYEEFKDSGFAIIGVVGGINNQEQFLNAIKAHDYPWTQLSEINKENQIWEKYNISSLGGSEFLVDNTGKIIAINPESEEIKKLITKQ